MQPDRPRVVPHPGERLGPGVEAARDQPVPDLLLDVLGDWGQVQRRVVAVAGKDSREEGREGFGDRVPGPGAHRRHHPPRGCATRLVRPRRAAHPVREDHDRLVEKRLDTGVAAAPRHDKPRTSRTILRVFVWLLRRYVCTATGQGREPTPGEDPT